MYRSYRSRSCRVASLPAEWQQLFRPADLADRNEPLSASKSMVDGELSKMNREDFKTISSQLKKGSKVRVTISSLRQDLPTEFTASVKDHGPSYIEVGIKGHRGLRRFLFNQVESIEIVKD